MGDVTKKQHYVPQMYLRNFCIDGEGDLCYEYNPYLQAIRKTRIEDICAENYLYEIRNKNGVFLFPDSINRIEEIFSKIESEDANFLRNILIQIDKADTFIDIGAEEREKIIGFVCLMLLRNPLIRDFVPRVLMEKIDLRITTKEEKSIAWIFTIQNIDKVEFVISNPVISFMKTSKEYPFITSSFPLWFSPNSNPRIVYMPLSATIAVLFQEMPNVLINLNHCEVREINNSETDSYNYKLVSKDFSLISSSKEILYKYHNQMLHPFDEGSASFYKSNVEYLKGMQKEDLLKLMIMIVEDGIQKKNDLYIETWNGLIGFGKNQEEATRIMAESIQDVFFNALLDKKKIDDDKLRIVFDKLLKENAI